MPNPLDYKYLTAKEVNESLRKNAEAHRKLRRAMGVVTAFFFFLALAYGIVGVYMLLGIV